ncbi:hypothetical protein BDQ17DRAFT_1295259 [Cyathus striatus]|nr:hypothetical protein BDQ17DRAFT_1295259 [Cyathus striatus]
MSLPPVVYHFFRAPLPYTHTLKVQEAIHQIQHALRRDSMHRDYLLLLQHRPVYTAGRRQTEDSTTDERVRLKGIGADFVIATRGGQLTYHGPGQIVGYPLLDISRYDPTMGARDYVCRMEKMLRLYLKETHDISHFPSEHTGVFLDPTTKIASIGVQIRHRLTSHGFALNITREPLPWFDKIVACGLDGVKAGSVETAVNKNVNVTAEIPALVETFGRTYEREMVEMRLEDEGEVGDVIANLEKEAIHAGSWPQTPHFMT